MSIHQLTTKRGSEDEEDLKLLQRIAAKDKIAFEKIYRKFYPRLTRYLSRMMRRPDMVEEVVSDTLFVVWEKADSFQGRSKVSTWITGISYLKGIKALDKLKTMPEQHADDLQDNDPIPDSHDLIHKVGLEEWLINGLDRISADQRSVVELTYFSGHSYKEIAEIMQCPVNTVKTRMFHARRRLAKLLPLLEVGNQVSDTMGKLLQSEKGDLEQ
ncbi:MAG: sigma-70 family RNA polymerase sigma factor [Gammaproteobacteria bacterium]|jgi:RNA polymerase sigma-70 factor, ECF subfamily|nr:sigma-70 family RNA polymerase sigma factor [Gammaproteobacteria bacterium]MBT4493194.1 sigma-70 family RNA polymerase sigma factor [Gammaproteobacteria bacterium]MBT7369638.1 sigma-70 family RNA polymerase sigma factor [Gammaproteobacteria bacterium]